MIRETPIKMKTKWIRVEMPMELHKAFKVECAKNNQTFQDALTELIEYYNKPLTEKEDANK